MSIHLSILLSTWLLPIYVYINLTISLCAHNKYMYVRVCLYIYPTKYEGTREYDENMSNKIYNMQSS